LLSPWQQAQQQLLNLHIFPDLSGVKYSDKLQQAVGPSIFPNYLADYSQM
jgi:hypothetical protein